MNALVDSLRRLWALVWRPLRFAWLLLVRAFPWLGRFGAAVQEIWRKYNHDDCWTYAASVSFFLTISLIPLATLFFKAVALLLGSGTYSQGILKELWNLWPYMPEAFLKDTLAHSREVSHWGVGWAILLIGAHWGVNQLDRSLSHIFGLRWKPQRQTRKYHLLRRLGVVFVGLMFLIILLAAGFEWSLRRTSMIPLSLALTLTPSILGLVLVTLILQHLPRRHIRFSHALVGAAVSTGFWWLAKFAFGIYIKHTPTWGILYGGLGSLMAALVFLYYSCCIFLLGAEVTAYFYRHESTTGFQVPPSLRIQGPSRP